jgi:TRAP-type C4-dicarboxylate transport system permease small subunit
MSQHKVRPGPESTGSPAGPATAVAVLAAIGRLERLVTIAAFTVLIAVVFADVVSRELTGRGLHWAMQAGVYANYVVVLFGLGIASASDAHLRPRFADRWLPARLEPWLARLPDAGMALFCLGFASVAVDVVAVTRELGDRSAVLGNLVWPLQALLPVVFSLAAIRHALYARWPSLRPVPPPGTGEGAP